MLMLLLALIFIVCLGLTRYMRHYAVQNQVIDIPNFRSSHLVPTPRGGGVSFVLGLLLSLPYLTYLGWVPLSVCLACITGGFLVALLGFFDDHGKIATKWRFLGHFVASILILYWLGGISWLAFFDWTFPLTFANIIGAVFLVWLINLYNFMDGIDGLAAMEAITVCFGGALLYWLTGHYTLVVLPLFLAASVAGFLYWNFPPARIFMGDVGSGFLGIILGIIILEAGAVDLKLFWGWIILLGVFITDATVTLIRRALQKEVVYQAHRSHAYQRASRVFNSHLRVTFAVFLINVVWLWPMAMMVASGCIRAEIGLFMAYFPLVLLAIQFDAGKPD